MKSLIALVLSAATCAAPPTERCVPTSTRCNGANAEVCAPNSQWTPLLRCSELRPGDWFCGDTDGSASCYPIDAMEWPQ